MQVRKKVGVIGASGFVGKVLIEKLMRDKNVDLVAVINSAGNSWPILRFDVNIVQANLSNKKQIIEALHGCTHVVNLALGSLERMEADVENLINVCFELKISKLVHLSSVTVYGEKPDSLSEFENGPVLAKRGSYGWYKNRQDEKLLIANSKGLPTVILCPPHVTGPYARIFHQVMDAIENNSFALVDGGVYPCNLIDVNNLCEAIILGLDLIETDGKRIFVTNSDDFTWYDLTEVLCEMIGTDIKTIPRITAKEAKELENKYFSLKAIIRELVSSSQVKVIINNSVLRHNSFYYFCLRLIYKLSRLIIRKRNVTKLNLNSDGSGQDLNIWLCQQQLRGVTHSVQRAIQVLGYIPKVSSKESLKSFEKYLEELYGRNSDYWELIKKLK